MMCSPLIKEKRDRLHKLENIPYTELETDMSCGVSFVTLKEVRFPLTERNVELLELIDAMISNKKSKDKIQSLLIDLDVG